MDEEIKWPMITKDTPMSELKRIHQMIWDYAIEYGYKPETPYVHDCAACEYGRYSRTKCQDCPIIWPKNYAGIRKCTGVMGLYSQWYMGEGEEKTALAKQIRDLPWRFELGENHI